MVRRWHGNRGDGGETLIELIVSITILGIVAIAIGTGITVSVIVADAHRKQTTATAFLHNYAEALSTSATTLYKACSAAPNYVTLAGLAAPNTSFNAPSQTNIQYWNGTGWQTAQQGCPSPDLGLERVTLALSSKDGRANESVVVVVRQQ